MTFESYHPWQEGDPTPPLTPNKRCRFIRRVAYVVLRMGYKFRETHYMLQLEGLTNDEEN